MEMLCPECRGQLDISDGETAVCTIHGGRYKILFTRAPRAAAAPEATVAPATDLTGVPCKSHPAVNAAQVCQSCAVPMCQTCLFAAEGKFFCGTCMVAAKAKRPAYMAKPAAGPLPLDIKCTNHADVPAVRRCKLCSAPTCETCTFTLPPETHVCPKCAAAPRTDLSSSRKKTLIFSYLCAAWCSVGLVAFLVASVALAQTKGAAEGLGVLFSIGVLIPSLIGIALSFSSYDSRLANPVSVWISLIWNGGLMAILLLLIILGTLMG